MKVTIIILLIFACSALISVARCNNMISFDIPPKEDIIKITISSVKKDDPYWGLRGNRVLLKNITNEHQIENILNFIEKNNNWYVPWNLSVHPSTVAELVNSKGSGVLIIWFDGSDAIGMVAPITSKKPASVWMINEDAIEHIKTLLGVIRRVEPSQPHEKP